VLRKTLFGFKTYAEENKINVTYYLQEKKIFLLYKFLLCFTSKMTEKQKMLSVNNST